MLFLKKSPNNGSYAPKLVKFQSIRLMTGSDFRVLTKSSPESAPTEVMDSLLMVRGIRTLLRGAVAASSAIFFFNLANIANLSGSLFECNLQFLESK